MSNEKDISIPDLSFESMSDANKSFTLGLGAANSNSNPQIISSFNNCGEDYPSFKSHQQQQFLISQIKMKNQFSKQRNEGGTAGGNIYTAYQSSTHSTSKNQGASLLYEETPTQNKQNPGSLKFHQQIQQSSPLLQPVNTGHTSSNGYMMRAQAFHEMHHVPNGFQDLFYKDSNDSVGGNNGFQQSPGQKLWPQQIVQQHLSRQGFQAKSTLPNFKFTTGDNITGSAYTVGQNSNQKVQMSPIQYQPQMQYSKSRDGGYRNIPMRDLSSLSDNVNDNTGNASGMNYRQLKLRGEPLDEHPFKKPKLHLFKKDANRRIKTSSATRNLQPIYPLEGLGGVFLNNKLFSNNSNSIHIGGGGTTTSNNMPGVLTQPDQLPSSLYYNSNVYQKSLLSNQNFTKAVKNSEQQENISLNKHNSTLGGAPLSQLQLRKLIPLSNNNFKTSLANHSEQTTIDASYHNNESDLLIPRLSALSSIPDSDISSVNYKISIQKNKHQVKKLNNNLVKNDEVIQAQKESCEIEISDESTKKNDQDELPLEKQNSKAVQSLNQSQKELNLKISDPPKANTYQNQEINGFKHSFYVEKPAAEQKPSNNLRIPQKQHSNSSKQESRNSKNKLNQHGITTALEKDGVKHIFVINVNTSNDAVAEATASQAQSLQESKAMTPCFLHTPNMTNKWNDFKAAEQHQNSSGRRRERPDNAVQNQSQQYIHHQANPSEQSDINPLMNMSNNSDCAISNDCNDKEPEQPLFVRSKLNISGAGDVPDIILNGSDISNLQQIIQKKPMTSHWQSKGGPEQKKKGLFILKQGGGQDISSGGVPSTANSIKLNPSDIYLQNSNQQYIKSGFSNGTTTKFGSQNSQSSLSQQQQQHQQQQPKPLTSGGSFRRPLSRNHPMLNLVSKNGGGGGASSNTEGEGGSHPVINVLQHQQLQQRGISLTTGSGVNALILNQRIKLSKQQQQKGGGNKSGQEQLSQNQ